MVREIRILEKLDIKQKKKILDLDFLISCKRNSGFQIFLLFKVSNKQLRTSKTCTSCQKLLINMEINVKQKAVEVLEQTFIEVKDSLCCKMSYTDYVQVCNTFMVCNNKNISEVK